MKVTSQIRSLTCFTPTFCPAKTWLTLILRRFQRMRPHVRAYATRIDPLVALRHD
jgi:hypothetical protein